ncbi:MAG: hypothetical protein LBP50_00830 [Tannerella sp.]|jgi:hypothetical protein|nr:hypothetical protein [Tannerella sp.]
MKEEANLTTFAHFSVAICKRSYRSYSVSFILLEVNAVKTGPKDKGSFSNEAEFRMKKKLMKHNRQKTDRYTMEIIPVFLQLPALRCDGAPSPVELPAAGWPYLRVIRLF